MVQFLLEHTDILLFIIALFGVVGGWIFRQVWIMGRVIDTVKSHEDILSKIDSHLVIYDKDINKLLHDQLSIERSMDSLKLMIKENTAKMDQIMFMMLGTKISTIESKLKD